MYVWLYGGMSVSREPTTLKSGAIYL